MKEPISQQKFSSNFTLLSNISIILFLLFFLSCSEPVVNQNSPPSSPLNLVATPSDELVTLSWSPPSNNGGSQIFEYTIYRGLSSIALSALTVINSTSTTFLDTNVDNETTYFYAATARNSYGEGPRSPIASTTPTSPNQEILEVDSLGNIIGGDFSDWCLSLNSYNNYVFSKSSMGLNSNQISGFVELSSFSSRVLNSKISLYWSTVSESNCEGFDIERKNCGTSEYERMGFVKGSGTTTEQRDYEFVTNFNESGQYCYRIKARAFNGNFEYFYLGNEVGLGIPTSASFGPVFRNPVISVSKLHFGLTNDENISIYFLNGSDTVFVLRNEYISAGYKNIYLNKTALGFNNIIKRVIIKSPSFVIQSDCKNYGDVQF